MIDHARRTDPRSSDRTVKSIVKDGSLAALVLDAAASLEAAAVQCGAGDDPCFNDTELWLKIEMTTRRRHQRNVIARTRGLLMGEGRIVAVGPRDFEGRELEHYRLPFPEQERLF